MNDPLLYVEKLRELIELASCASNGFERAAVFSASQAISKEFDEEDFDGYALEKVENVRWHIAAAIGYDVTNGHSSVQHLSWASGAVITLEDVLKRK